MSQRDIVEITKENQQIKKILTELFYSINNKHPNKDPQKWDCPYFQQLSDIIKYDGFPFLDKKLDEILELVDSLMEENKLEELDEHFKNLSIYENKTIIVGWLSASLPVKSKLPHRANFVKMIEPLLGSKLLKGLI